MELDAVVIIADILDDAKLAEQAVRLAGVQAPMYGASGIDESSKTRARGAALHSARLARDVTRDICGIYLPNNGAAQKVGPLESY